MLVSLTVGKVDAGVAVLLTDDKRLIEFPSILLPPDISSGSIVDITVSRNFIAEAESQSAFATLQHDIFTTFGQRSPSPPILRCRNATQTSVVLEWDPIQLATAQLRSLALYRNGAKAGNIPKPLETQSTKMSGLAVDTEYTFHLVLRTSAGTYSSQRLVVRTHKMTDLSGITVTPGVLPAPLRESLEKAIDRIGAKIADTVRIDTTHFVCTEGKGQQWERALETNIPVVRPEWVEGCEREGRIVGVREYYLNADPRLRTIGPGARMHQQQQGQGSTSALTSPPMSPRGQDGDQRQKQASTKTMVDRTSNLRKEKDGGNAQRNDSESTSTGTIIAGRDGNRNDDGDVVGKDSEESDSPPPPRPPPKDRHPDDDGEDDDDEDDDEDGDMEPPEPKQQVGDEPKVRREDRPQLGGNVASAGLGTNGTKKDSEKPQPPKSQPTREKGNGVHPEEESDEDDDDEKENGDGDADGEGRVRGEGEGEGFSEVAL
ncbi:MAG: Chitin synthase, class 5 [Watsoniomyces obsoletus]|nr:MAG: Chitin synthase, class 5 [Watsoniomyces obsoletus]